MICVDHLCYHYKGGRPILRDVSFELEDGRFLAVLGNNGVGKSTLLKCMNRILTADSGHCRIDGEDLLTLSHREIAKRVAFVAQHVPDTQMTVHDMVMLGRRPYMTWGVTEHDHDVVHDAMRYLNLEDMSVQLVFLPIDKPMEKCNMEKFVRDLVNKLDFANKKASDCGYELIKFFDHNSSFYLSEFYKMITDMKNDNNVHPEDEQHFIVRPQKAEAIEDKEVPLQTTVVSTPSFKLAKEVKDYSGNDIGFDDDSDITSTTVLTNASKSKPGPVIVRTRTGERIKIDKPIFCIGKSAQGVDYQVTDNNSVSRRHAYILSLIHI